MKRSFLFFTTSYIFMIGLIVPVFAKDTKSVQVPYVRNFEESNNLGQSRSNLPITFSIFQQLPSWQQASGVWGDYDNDGDLDLAVKDDYGHINIYKNKVSEGSGFEPVNPGIDSVDSGQMVWVDYDSDGDLDLAVTGHYFGSPAGKDPRHIRIYQNNNGIFTRVDNWMLEHSGARMAWGDFDNDGDPDCLTGWNTMGTRIFRNDGNNVFVDMMVLPGFIGGSVAWVDYDNDGDLDISMGGYAPNPAGGGDVPALKIYRNDGPQSGGGWQFIDSGVAIQGYEWGNHAWGDYDNDGDLDVALTTTNTPRLYRNDNGSFVDTGYYFPGYFDVAWGDHDNDGDLDLVVQGCSNDLIYENQNGVFYIENPKNVLLPGGSNTGGESISWGDFDNDGDLDIFVAGNNMQIMRNENSLKNTPPMAPIVNLQPNVSGNTMTLFWQKATDLQTPQAGLNYNVYIGTTPSMSNVVSPMAQLNNGWRKVVSLGPQRADPNNSYVSWMIRGLANGLYYSGVQALDSNFAGSSFTPGSSFIIGPYVIISGYIKDKDKPIAGVQLRDSLVAGAPILAVTNANGYYSFPRPEGWSGMVKPFKKPLIFFPQARNYVNIQASTADQNYGPYVGVPISAGGGKE